MALLLKDFQRRTVAEMEAFFEALTEEHEKFQRIPEEVLKEYGDINWPEKAWQRIFPLGHINDAYRTKKTGHGKHCPHYCLRLPTGGGKTLMATYAIEQYLKSKKKPIPNSSWKLNT